MDDDELLGEFRRVCKIAMPVERDCDSVTELEPYLIQILELARQMSKTFAIRCFTQVAHGDLEAPYETVPFCMHALRFLEVRDELRRWVGDPPDPRRMNYASHVWHAYSDDWEDRDQWPYFQK
jgi:hypothetical protein